MQSRDTADDSLEEGLIGSVDPVVLASMLSAIEPAYMDPEELKVVLERCVRL